MLALTMRNHGWLRGVAYGKEFMLKTHQVGGNLRLTIDAPQVFRFFRPNILQIHDQIADPFVVDLWGPSSSALMHLQLLLSDVKCKYAVHKVLKEGTEELIGLKVTIFPETEKASMLIREKLEGEFTWERIPVEFILKADDKA